MEEVPANRTAGTAAVASKYKVLKKISKGDQGKYHQLRETKTAKELRKAEQKQVGKGSSSEALQAGLPSQRRATNLEKWVLKVVTRLNFTQRKGTNPSCITMRNQQQPDNRLEVPAPLAPARNSDLGSDAPPGRRVTVTFYTYQQGE
jgi:hypothetical protein